MKHKEKKTEKCAREDFKLLLLPNNGPISNRNMQYLLNEYNQRDAISMLEFHIAYISAAAKEDFHEVVQSILVTSLYMRVLQGV